MALAQLKKKNAQEMAPLVWRPSFECGHAMIDLQHKGLIADANAVIAAAADGQRSLLTRRLDELVTQVMHHFRDEEALLELHGYADLQAHRGSHLRLLEEMLTLRQELLHSPDRAAEFAEFITRAVVLKHLIDEDQRYFSSLRP